MDNIVDLHLGEVRGGSMAQNRRAFLLRSNRRFEVKKCLLRVCWLFAYLTIIDGLLSRH